MSKSLAIALASGMVATVNPCGFTLLPAYLSAFLGLDDPAGRLNPVGRAIKVSAVMTAGFVTVFGVIGLIVHSLLTTIQDYLYYVTLGVGLVIIGMGIYLVTGHEITVALPKLNRGATDGTLVGMYLFGVSYAVASLSCSIGPFLGVTSSAFTNEGFLAGVLGFVLYGVGMGLVVGVLTVAVTLAKDGVVNRFRRLLPIINRVAGALMIVAGAYVAYYGWYVIRLFVRKDADFDDPIIDAGLSIQRWLASLFPGVDSVWMWGLVMAAVLAVVVLVARRRQAAPTSEEDREMAGSAGS